MTRESCWFKPSVGVLTLAAVVLVALERPAAQMPPGPAPSAAAQSGAKTVVADPGAGVQKVPLTAGRSTVLTTEFDITRIAVTNPAVADATVVQPREVLIDGKSAGTVSLIIWGAGRRIQYDVVVEAGITTLQQNLRMFFPGEDINVSVNDEAIILSGHASSNSVVLKAGEIAQASSAKSRILNLLQLPPGGVVSQQVMLQVRFAEVNRRALTNAGLALFTGAAGYKDWVGRETTQQYAAPMFDEGKTTFSDLLNLFVFNSRYNMGAVLKALQASGNFQSLAEPNLIAYNGREASFLAGGQIPVPVVQGLSNTVTIEWKEFGIRLTFTPTIAGDVIRLKVEPEVSALDFNNGITLQGYRIPALTTRRARTEVELRDGQSFAIAGLLSNVSQDDKQGIALLSHIPILGNLFKSKAVQKEQTELMVLITPQLVRPLEPDEVPVLPTDSRKFIRGTGVGAQLEGGGGLVDAPPAVPKPTQPPAKPPKNPGGVGGAR